MAQLPVRGHGSQQDRDGEVVHDATEMAQAVMTVRMPTSERTPRTTRTTRTTRTVSIQR